VRHGESPALQPAGRISERQLQLGLRARYITRYLVALKEGGDASLLFRCSSDCAFSPAR